MRIALAQVNCTVGAVRSNRELLAAAYVRARAAGADLVVFPELAICGYPPLDLLEQEAFLAACRREMEALAAVTQDGGAALVGFPEALDREAGRGAANAAALLDGGRVAAVVHKALLPTYDVFDEARYFEPAAPGQVAPLPFRGRLLGVTICEDAWNDADFWPRRLYAFDPVARLLEQGADLLVNLSASPFHLGKQSLRRRMLSTLAASERVPVLHCNLVGANDELVFDGASFAAWPDGSIRGSAASFAEDLVIVDLDAPPPPEPVDRELPPEDAAIEALTLGIRDYFSKCGFSRAVLGLSGGIDSAVTAALAARALGADRVTGITMPSRYSSSGSVEDSRKLAEALGISFFTVPIAEAHHAYHAMLGPLWEEGGLSGTTEGITDQNIQARVRGNILMAFSNRTGALLLSTGNKSELAVGYCTLYGDMAGGLAVISDLPKTFVYRVARRLNAERELIPEATLDKPPSAELAPDQLDEDSLPPYPVLDAVLRAYVEDGVAPALIAARTGVAPETVERVVRMVDRNEYKRRQAAQGLRVTSKAFGRGRRFPIAARFQHHDWTG